MEKCFSRIEVKVVMILTFNIYIRYEALTAVVVRSAFFWDIIPCSLLKVNQRFGGTSYLHLEG
jgi:hypothetical protein